MKLIIVDSKDWIIFWWSYWIW